MESKARPSGLLNRLVVSEMSLKIYERYVGADKITDTERSWTVDPENRLIKLTPQKTYSW